MIDYQKIRIISKIFTVCMTIGILFVLASCENKERFYRPNLPEQLCSVGIIDVDDTIKYGLSFLNVKDIRNSMRFITFEKSVQSEYPEVDDDTLDEFEFVISSENREIFSYRSSSKIKSPLKFEIPNNIKFNSGESYFLKANVKDLSLISSSTVVPNPPSDLTLISIKKEEVQISMSTPCPVRNTATSVHFDISFTNENDKRNYYAILLIGRGMLNMPIPYSGPLDFSVKETNTPGFFAEIQGLNTLHWECTEEGLETNLYQVLGFFIDGSEIPGNSCNIKLFVQYNDGYSPLESFNSARIKLLSISEEFYLFEKNLRNYTMVQKDPFSEPVYLKGNILNGNGVFAICRSSNLNINLVTGNYE